MGILKNLFGRKGDTNVVKREGQSDVFHVSSEEEAMNAAMEKARITLDYFKTSLASPLERQQYFSLKVRLEENGYSEHIWLHNVSFDENNNYYGEVGNKPLNLKKLKEGQQVGVGLKDVSDWMILENGRLIGGYTIRTLRDRMEKKKQAEFDNSLGFHIDEGIDYYPHDFTTPEGAILCLEDAYRAKDLDYALACKDFTQEARLAFTKMKHLEQMADDPTMIASMAEVLRLSFIKNMNENFPDFTDVQNAFPKREKVNENLVVVTEVCYYADHTKSAQRLYVANTENGWRVLNPAD